MSYASLPYSDNFPETINVVVEIPRGSRNKYEYDEKLDVIKLDRVLHSSMTYPAEYGFVPQTRADDGDNLDALVFISEPVLPGIMVPARPIGLLDMDDDKGKDWKVITVADKDPRFTSIHTLDQIEDMYLKEIQQFFEVYKQLENKTVTFNGWLPREKAVEIIKAARERY